MGPHLAALHVMLGDVDDHPLQPRSVLGRSGGGRVLHQQMQASRQGRREQAGRRKHAGGQGSGEGMVGEARRCMHRTLCEAPEAIPAADQQAVDEADKQAASAPMNPPGPQPAGCRCRGCRSAGRAGSLRRSAQAIPCSWGSRRTGRLGGRPRAGAAGWGRATPCRSSAAALA